MRRELVLLIASVVVVIGMLELQFEVQKVEGQPQAWIAVNLPQTVFEFKDFFEPLDVANPYKGDRVTVQVDINVTNLYSFQYKLRWNNTLLNVTRYTIFSPWGEGNYSVSADETSDLGNGYGQHFLSLSANETAGAPPFNGTKTVCEYTFDLKHYPFYPLPTATSSFNLTNTQFFDPLGQPMDHSICDGSCEFRQEVVPLVKVDPINWALSVGSNCTAYVRISNVTRERIQDYCEEFMGVHGMVLDLYFDTEYLDALSVEPNRTAPKSPAGHFFDPIDASNLFFAEVSMVDDYFGNGTYGRVRLALVILKPEEPKLGGGVLARINFNITASGTGRPLRLYAPGHPFPLHLSYTNDKLHRAGVVPCTLEVDFPPTIVVVSPENKTYASTSVPLNFTISEPTSWIGYSLDGADNETVTGNKLLINLTDGSHHVTVYANDTFGYMGVSDTVYFSVDTPPSIVIVSPANGSYTSTSVPLNFTLSESTHWIGYSLDGTTNVTVTGNTTITVPGEGLHNITVYANDTIGNMRVSETVHFTVDNTPPDISDVSQSPDGVMPTDTVQINATVTDDLSGVKQVFLNYTNGNGTWVIVEMSNVAGDVWNGTIPAFPYCTNVTYIVMAEDNVGNTVTTEEMDLEYKYHVIPEFPLFLILPLCMLTTLFAVFSQKKNS